MTFFTNSVYTIFVQLSTPGQNSDGREEAAGAGALFAVAEEEVGAAGGAEVADKNGVVPQASGEELRAVGFAEVKANVFWRRLVTGRGHVEPLEGIGFLAGARFVEVIGGVGKLRGELGDEVGADFVAAGADGRTEGGEEVGGPGTETHLHLTNGLCGDAGEGAAPAGMDGRDGAPLGIDEEDGYAVGGLNAKEQSGSIADRRIAFAGFLGRGAE